MEILSHKIKGGQKFEQWNSNNRINWGRSSTTIFTFWTNGISNDGSDCIFYDGKMNEKRRGQILQRPPFIANHQCSTSITTTPILTDRRIAKFAPSNMQEKTILGGKLYDKKENT